MNTVTITSVSTAAAKAALGRLASTNGMIYICSTIANSDTVTAGMLGGNKVRIWSTYFSEVSLLEIAQRASGRGTVTVA
jgi:hypothetical protein